MAYPTISNLDQIQSPLTPKEIISDINRLLRKPHWAVSETISRIPQESQLLTP